MLVNQALAKDFGEEFAVGAHVTIKAGRLKFWEVSTSLDEQKNCSMCVCVCVHTHLWGRCSIIVQPLLTGFHITATVVQLTRPVRSVIFVSSQDPGCPILAHVPEKKRKSMGLGLGSFWYVLVEVVCNLLEESVVFAPSFSTRKPIAEVPQVLHLQKLQMRIRSSPSSL